MLAALNILPDLGAKLGERAGAREEPVPDWLVRVAGLSAVEAAAIAGALAGANEAHARVQGAAATGVDASEWLTTELTTIPGLSPTVLDALAGALGFPGGRPIFALAGDLAGLAGSALGTLGEAFGLGAASGVQGLGDFAGAWLAAPLGSPLDDELAALAAAHVLPMARAVFGDGADGASVATALHLGASAVKAAFKVATGAITPGAAAQWLGERTVACVATLVRHVATHHAEDVGAAIGSALGAFVGVAPIGAMLGAAVGRHIKEFVAQEVGDALESMGRVFVRPAVNVVGVAVSVVKRFASFFGG